MCGSMIKQTVSDILFAKYSNAKLEQLECLRSEDTPPPPHDYPHYWVMLAPKSNWKPKNLRKIEILEFCYKLNLWHTL